MKWDLISSKLQIDLKTLNINTGTIFKKYRYYTVKINYIIIFIIYLQGSKSSKALSALSSDASGKLVVFQKTLRSIASDEKICITENRLQYEKDWDKVYDEFTDCLNGLIEVPTEAPSSSRTL